jgi:serine protease Do
MSSVLVPDWTPPALSDAELPADLSNIVDEVVPWVAAINVEVTSPSFFGEPSTQQGAGSGWIIDANGLIVTNSHVIEGANNITVSLNDGRVFTAQEVAADTASDLAVIKIDATGLPAAPLGDSSRLKRGMMVMAVGNALGEGISVAAGWVSQLRVSITIPDTSAATGETLFDLIQVSAPINPGNSGGPLVNMLGEVVGITNVKLISQAVENVGYAISINSAIPLIEQLIETGQIARPYMGIMLRTLTPDIASMFNLPVTEGAIVTQIEPGGPAANAGLQTSDVITAINGQPVTSGSDAVEIIRSSEIGQEVTVTYYRDNNEATVQVTLAENPNS